MTAEVGKTQKRRLVVINQCFTQRAIFLPHLHTSGVRLRPPFVTKVAGFTTA